MSICRQCDTCTGGTMAYLGDADCYWYVQSERDSEMLFRHAYQTRITSHHQHDVVWRATAEAI